MAGIEVKGVEAFAAKFKVLRAQVEADVVTLRVNVVTDLLEELMKNIPVWSGRTIEGIRINTDGSFAPLQGVLPINAFPGTNKLALGSEPERPKAEAAARAELPNATASIKTSVFLTIASEAWSLIEIAQAPGPRPNGEARAARNTAVVSEIALATVRSKYEGTVK